MPNSWHSKFAWEQIQCAYGDSREVGELLQLVLAGEDVWGDLINHVLHQGTVYEATVAVTALLVEALQTEMLGERLIPVGKPYGRNIVLSEKALAFSLLSSIAESAHEAIHAGSTRKQYSTIGALVLETLRPGIPLYEAGAENPDDQIREASSALLEALAAGCPAAAIDSQYRRRLETKLGMPLSPPTT
jgi:hypothetical protein